MYSKVLLVFIGGGIGSVARFLINYFINFSILNPFSTLLVNVVGSFLFGIIYSIIAQNTLISLFLLTGMLGGVHYIFTIYYWYYWTEYPISAIFTRLLFRYSYFFNIRGYVRCVHRK